MKSQSKSQNTGLKRTIWKIKKHMIVKVILYFKGTSRDITIPDIKLYYRAIITKTAWSWHKNRHVHQWKQIEDPEMKPHTYEHLIIDKEAKTMQWGKESIFQQWC